MGRKIMITSPAPENTVFTSYAFNKSIGKRFPLSGDAIPEWSKGTLISAKVHSDEKAVDLTIEIDDK